MKNRGGTAAYTCYLIAIGADVRSACSTRFQTRTPFALRTGSQFAVERESDSASAIVRDGAAALYFAVRLRSPRALSNDTTAARAATPTHTRTGVAGFCAIRFREHRSTTHLEGSREAHRSPTVALMQGELRARAHADGGAA